MGVCNVNEDESRCLFIGSMITCIPANKDSAMKPDQCAPIAPIVNLSANMARPAHYSGRTESHDPVKRLPRLIQMNSPSLQQPAHLEFSKDKVKTWQLFHLLIST